MGILGIAEVVAVVELWVLRVFRVVRMLWGLQSVHIKMPTLKSTGPFSDEYYSNLYVAVV